MAGIRVQWSQFGKVDSFSVYRSESAMDLSNLPPAIATDIQHPEYWDYSVITGMTYHYVVSSIINGVLYIGDEQISILAINNDFLFVTGDTYIPPITPTVNFIW